MSSGPRCVDCHSNIVEVQVSAAAGVLEEVNHGPIHGGVSRRKSRQEQLEREQKEQSQQEQEEERMQHEPLLPLCCTLLKWSVFAVFLLACLFVLIEIYCAHVPKVIFAEATAAHGAEHRAYDDYGSEHRAYDDYGAEHRAYAEDRLFQEDFFDHEYATGPHHGPRIVAEGFLEGAFAPVVDSWRGLHLFWPTHSGNIVGGAKTRHRRDTTTRSTTHQSSSSESRKYKDEALVRSKRFVNPLAVFGGYKLAQQVGDSIQSTLGSIPLNPFVGSGSGDTHETTVVYTPSPPPVIYNVEGAGNLVPNAHGPEFANVVPYGGPEFTSQEYYDDGAANVPLYK